MGAGKRERECGKKKNKPSARERNDRVGARSTTEGVTSGGIDHSQLL